MHFRRPAIAFLTILIETQIIFLRVPPVNETKIFSEFIELYAPENHKQIVQWNLAYRSFDNVSHCKMKLVEKAWLVKSRQFTELF